MSTVARIIGGAGTGKTTRLMEIMSKTLESGVRDPLQVGFVSYTRAARREASVRAGDQFGVRPEELEQDGWFRTLHSVCCKMLKIGGELISDSAADKRWIGEALGVEVPEESEDFSDLAFSRSSESVLALSLWDASRNRLVPLKSIWEQAAAVDHRVPDFQVVEQLVSRYEQAKRLGGRQDFSDVLCRFVGKVCRVDGISDRIPDGDVPGIPVWFFDECQDSSALLHAVELRLMQHAKWCYVVGDPFQCQPSGTPVLTTAGYKNIEDLDENLDRLVAYSTQDGRFYGTGKGIKFQKACRAVDSSSLLEITTEDGTVHIATENHKWLCRTVKGDCYATYLMRKGDRYRVGTVQMFASQKQNGSDFRLGMRCNQESAEEAWILKVSDTDSQARCYEQIVSCRFGIPQVTFRPTRGNRSNLGSQEFIDAIFRELGDLTQNAMHCLKSHGLCHEFPYWTKASNRKNGGLASRQIASCNLLPGITSIPRMNPDAWRNGRLGRKNGVSRKSELRQSRTLSGRVGWQKIVSVRRLPSGTPTIVHSLNVETHHTYITKDFVTCNSIYGFSGASSRHFMGLEVAKEETLAKSYRCPKPVHRLGERILEQCSDYWDRGISSADHHGDLESRLFKDGVADEINPNEEWLVIARSNHHARRIAAILDKRDIPWIPTRGRGGWNAPVRNAGLLALLALQRGRPIDGAEWQQALKIIPSKIDGLDLLGRGTKASFSGDPVELSGRFPWVQLPDLDKLGGTPLLEQTIANGEWREFIPQAEGFVSAIEHWGEDIVVNPVVDTGPHENRRGVRLGTIHSAKGCEANNVVYLTSTSEQVRIGQETTEGYNEERRVEYVAVTRARKRLIVAHEKANPKAELPF